MILPYVSGVNIKVRIFVIFFVDLLTETLYYICKGVLQRGITMADEELRKAFAKKLRYYLDLNGYNQADLARHMHVTTATTAKWCTGKTMPRIDKVQSICNWLGIQKSDLLEEVDHGSEFARSYYLNPETARIAQQIYDDPDLHALFDAASDSDPEDMQMAADLLKRLKKTNPDG